MQDYIQHQIGTTQNRRHTAHSQGQCQLHQPQERGLGTGPKIHVLISI